ncbi:unnamed protein product, partial [Rotaria sp. Silwood1]
CEFFHVSYLSFVHDVSTSRKEGYLQEESINYYFDYHAFLRASCFCDLCKCYDTSKWFIIKDSYIVDIRPDIHEKCFPMLVDCDFQISSDIQNIGYDDDIKIINSQRILLIKCRTAHNCNEWAKHLSNRTQQAKDFASETRNRSDSYAPIRENQLAYYRVDVGNAYGTTLKLPSDIAAENEPSAGTKTVQMVTTKMAEQAGEAPIKCETYLKNDFYPFLLPKSYDDVQDLAVENWRDFLKSEPFRVNVQYACSVGPWSAGTKSEKLSIHNGYIQTIDIAKHFIYIEVEISYVLLVQDSVVQNQLADVLFRRIIERAHKNAKKFHLYVVLPLLPDFDNTNSVQAVLYFIMINHYSKDLKMQAN